MSMEDKIVLTRHEYTVWEVLPDGERLFGGTIVARDRKEALQFMERQFSPNSGGHLKLGTHKEPA